MRNLSAAFLAALLFVTPAVAQPVPGAQPPSAVGKAVPGQIPGTATNDSAGAGKVGERVTASRASGSPAALTTTVGANVTSISLTPGDYDVEGSCWLTGGATTTLTQANCGISLTTGNVGTIGGPNRSLVILTGAQAPFAVNDFSLPIVRTQVSVATTTTVYLNALATFGISTASVYGQLTARRVR